MKKRMIDVLRTNAKKGYASTMLALMMTLSFSGVGSTVAYAAGPQIVYQAHVSGLGWMGDVINGVIATSATTPKASRKTAASP